MNVKENPDPGARPHPALTTKLRPARLSLAVALALALCCLSGTATIIAPEAQAETPQQKIVQGKVLDEGDTPQPGAIVYLKSAKSDGIKSFIATADGGYRFGQLQTDTDYSLWAELNGKKSPTKTITAFDSKKQLMINLHLK